MYGCAGVKVSVVVDNVPGAPGVGPGTAAKLLQQFGTLDNLLAHVDEVKPDKLREKLIANQDDVLLWRRLVTIDREAPVVLDMEAARLGQYDRAAAVAQTGLLRCRAGAQDLVAYLIGPDLEFPGAILRVIDLQRGLHQDSSRYVARHAPALAPAADTACVAGPGQWARYRSAVRARAAR